MLYTRSGIRRISQVATACLFTGLGVFAQAQDLNVQNGAITVTGEAAFSANPTVASTGLVSQVTGIPLATNQLVPGFSFTLLNEGVADGTYTFRIGMTVDDDNSQRRLEAVINQLQLTVAGGVITGVNPAGQSLDFIGRDRSGTLTVTLNDPILNDDLNGPITVTNGLVELDADDLIDRIQVSTLALTDIVDEFDDPGHFTYRIAAYQIGGPATIRFGTGATFSAFPRIQTNCDNSEASRSASVFTLNSSEFAPQFPLAYAVQGQYSVSGAAGSAGSAPTAFTEDCSSGGSGGTGGTGGTGGSGEDPDVPISEQVDAANQELDAILLPATGTISDEQEEAIDNALDTVLSLAESAAGQSTRSSTDFTNIDAQAALDTINDALDLAGDATEKGGTVDSTKAFNAARSVADILTGLKSRSLTPQQKEDYTESAKDALASVTRLINSATDANNLANLIAVATDMLSAISEMNGDTLDDDLVDTIKGMSSAVMDSQFTKPGTSVFLDAVDPADKEAVKALAAQKPALAFLIAQNAVSKPKANPAWIRITLFKDAVIDPFFGNNQPARTDIVTRNVASLNITNGAQAYTEAYSIAAISYEDHRTTKVELAYEASGPFYEVQNNESAFSFIKTEAEAETNSQQLNADNGSSPSWYTQLSSKIYPDSMPDGIVNLPDGSIVNVVDSEGLGLAPEAYNTTVFTELLAEAILFPSQRGDGSWDISLGDEVSVIGVFAYDELGTPTQECTEITVDLPTGDVADAAHVYTVNCDNGVSQRFAPYLGDTALYDALIDLGLDVSTDRNTGIITAEGNGSFKPSFFVYDLTFEEQVFLSQNGGDLGMAFQALDANGDGKTDFVYLTDNGSQVLYGLQ